MAEHGRQKNWTLDTTAWKFAFGINDRVVWDEEKYCFITITENATTNIVNTIVSIGYLLKHHYFWAVVESVIHWYNSDSDKPSKHMNPTALKKTSGCYALL